MKLLVSYKNLSLFQTSSINIDLGGVSSDSLNTFCHLGLVKPIFHSSSTKELIPIAWGSSQLPKEMCFMLFNFSLHIGLSCRSMSWEFSFLQYQSFHWLIKKMCFCFICGRCADDKPYEPTYMVSQEKTKSLGIDFTPLEVSMKDTVESLREKNFVSFWHMV